MQKIKRLLLATIMSGLASVAWGGPLTQNYSNLFVFGDSLVDTGNTQALFLAGTGGALDVTPASAGYFGGRFTNGVNLADVVNQAIEGTNLTGSLLGGDNYSFGGARARTDADPVPDLTLQVNAYLNDIMGVADPNALHLINVGGNDIRDILLGGLNSTQAAAVITDAASTVASQVVALQSAGASEFLFVGVGNVGGIPEILPFGPGAVAAGRALSEQLNAAIEAVLSPLGVDLYDTIGFFDDVLPVLVNQGINTTVPCLDAAVGAPVGPPICDGYAFFDSVHPSTQSMRLLGDDIVAHLVPVPATGLLFGFGLLILATRRK